MREGTVVEEALQTAEERREVKSNSPLWSPELWVTWVRRMAGLRGADSRLPWAAPSFSPTATDRLLHPRDPKPLGSQIPSGPTSEKLLLGIPSQSPSPPSLWDTVMKARAGRGWGWI